MREEVGEVLQDFRRVVCAGNAGDKNWGQEGAGVDVEAGAGRR